MNKTFITMFCLALCSTALFAQKAAKLTDTAQTNRLNKRIHYTGNEFKFSPLYLVLGAIDLSYERSLNQESAVGINVSIPFDHEVINYDYFVTPYYRYFFGKAVNTGFFLEGFATLNTPRTNHYRYDNSDGQIYLERYDKVTDFAMGVGLGFKLVTQKGFLFELNGGIARRLSEDLYEQFLLRVGLSIGYRF